jgi:hypothetical protein
LEFPIHFAAVSSNGCFWCGTCILQEEGHLTYRICAEHLTSEGSMTLPINVMLCDPRGRVLCVGRSVGQQKVTVH